MFCRVCHGGQVDPVAVGLHKCLNRPRAEASEHAWCFHCGSEGLSCILEREGFTFASCPRHTFRGETPTSPFPKGYQTLCIRAIVCSLPDYCGAACLCTILPTYPFT